MSPALPRGSPWPVRRGSAGRRPPPTFFPLLALLGADVKATTKDGDTVFTCIIFLLGETVGGDKEEAQLINRFCFQVTQLLLAHGADPSECPAHESLTHICLKSFKLHFPLLRFLLESGAAYNCSLHGASCWSGFHIVFERLCSHPGCAEDESHADLLRKAETVLDLMVTSSQKLRHPPRGQPGGQDPGPALLPEAAGELPAAPQAPVPRVHPPLPSAVARGRQGQGPASARQAQVVPPQRAQWRRRGRPLTVRAAGRGLGSPVGLWVIQVPGQPEGRALDPPVRRCRVEPGGRKRSSGGRPLSAGRLPPLPLGATPSLSPQWNQGQGLGQAQTLLMGGSAKH